MLKKVFIGLAALVVLAVLSGVFLLSNLDSIVKGAVEKYGSEAAQAKVELAEVSLSPTSGEGKLAGLRIKNPDGFKGEDAFFLGLIDVKVDMETVAGTGPIVIDKVIIDKPEVMFEVNESGSSNLQTIAHNAKNYSGQSVAAPSKEKAEASTPSDKARKIIVKVLRVSGGKVAVSHSMLKDKKIEAEIPTFTLHNLGENTGGMTAEALSSKMLSVMTQKASEAASKGFVNSLGIFSTVQDAAQVTVKEGAANVVDKASGTAVSVDGGKVNISGPANISIDKKGVNIKGLFGK